MPEPLVKAANNNLSEGKQKQRFAQALSDLKSSILFGYRKDLMTSLTLADVRKHALHVIAKKSFNEFAEEIGMSPRSAGRYADIGEMLREGVKRFKKLDASPEVLTQKDVFAAFDSLIQNGEGITLRGLAKASASYDEFSKYLSGAGEEAPVQKLLDAANKESVKKQSEEVKTESGTDYDEQFRRIAEEHGFVSDRNGNYSHRDGTPLTPREECLFISPSSAIRPAEDLEAALLKAIEITERSVKSFGDSFWKYREHGNDEPFQHAWKQKMALAKKRLQQLETQFQWIYNGPTEQEGVE